MIAAPDAPDWLADLRALLATMNSAPGQVDPANSLIPFERLDTVHFARLVVLDDETVDDIAIYGGTFPNAPIYLVLTLDCDGPPDAALEALVRLAEPGLRRIFGHCQGFNQPADLLAWLNARRVRPATAYVNWIGRTVRQAHEEQRLHEALAQRQRLAAGPAGETAVAAWRRLKQSVIELGPGLTPPSPTPLGWWVGEALTLLGRLLLLLVLAPFLILYLPIFLIILRLKETRDPVVGPPFDPRKMRLIGAHEDRDVTNPFSAIGAVKPGLFRLSIVVVVLAGLDAAVRLLYGRGRLARVDTIHFARWVLLDGGRRVFFASNYDGGLDRYMDDFINKAGFGLNLVFSNGIGYPRTNWLLKDGAADEQSFKRFLRRHQVLTDVWYKAYPGLTAFDLARNSRIRQGLERASMSEADAARWLAEI